MIGVHSRSFADFIALGINAGGRKTKPDDT
jgi:hypothetical protein